MQEIQDIKRHTHVIDGLVYIITILYVICYCIVQIALIVWLAKKTITLSLFIPISISYIVSLILLLGLNSALSRIQSLENFIIAKEKHKNKNVKYEDGSLVYDEKIEYCSNCNYQLFLEDKNCPNCGTPRPTKNNKK